MFKPLRNRNVLKYGWTTKLTHGIINVGNERGEDALLAYSNENRMGSVNIRLKNQIPVNLVGSQDRIHTHGNYVTVGQAVCKQFCAQGDSGSPVFIYDANGEYILVGIIVGTDFCGGAYMTPIGTILDEFQFNDSVQFESYPLVESVSESGATDDSSHGETLLCSSQKWCNNGRIHKTLIVHVCVQYDVLRSNAL